ncbi:MAG: hypothetical protein AB1489_42625 [Acidobacteriota bacterium]
MAQSTPSVDEWRNLYEAAKRIKELAPWQWMEETDIFGVQNPETGELGFVSVMGTLGEHFAIAVYLGQEGIYGFWGLQVEDVDAYPERVLEVPQLQASFEDRSELEEKDRAVIKQLGLKFRGQHAYPMFRSIQPGFVPWFLTAKEARFLTHALEQTMEIATQFKDNRSLFEDPNEERYLVRIPQQEKNQISWQNQVLPVPPPEPLSVPISMDMESLEELEKLPLSNLIIEVDFFMLPTPIREKGQKPYYPYMLLIAETNNGMIIGTELFKPEPDLTSMWGMIPAQVATQLAHIGVAPKEIAVRSDLVCQLLEPMATALNIKLKEKRVLHSIDQAKQALLQSFM